MFPKLYEHLEQGNFSDVVLQSWCIIELDFDEATLGSYRLSSQDPRSEPLLKLRFGAKLELFKKLRLVLRDEYKTLKDFNEKRNEIVHRTSGGTSVFDEWKKNEIMINAVQSAFIADFLFERIRNETKIKW